MTTATLQKPVIPFVNAEGPTPYAFSHHQQRTLRAVVDTLIPSIETFREDSESGSFWRRKATDLEVDRNIIETLAVLPSRVQLEFSLLLSTLASPLAGILAGTWPCSFGSLSATRREALLLGWSTSRFPQLRAAFAALKRMTVFAYYGNSQQGTNPNWKVIGYPGPPASVAYESPARRYNDIPSHLPGARGDVIDCETLVIGSGAGGGVVAGTLAEHGQDVIVIEKGPYVRLSERSNLEYEMVSKLYENREQQTNTDHSVSLFAGSSLGGGTTINWSVCWRPHEALLREWASDHGLPHLMSKDFERCVESVCRHLGVRPAAKHNFQNNALLRGSEQLKYPSGPLSQNVSGCEVHKHDHCGFCLFACRYGNKQGTVETFLQKARKNGARILVNVEARRLHRSAGEVSHVEALAKDPSGGLRPITIRAKRFVLAGGSLNTPALLLSSGFSHPQLGRNLHLHPATLVLGRYAAPVESWRGGMMTSYSVGADSNDGLDSRYKIEPTPLHCGLLASALPWLGGESHKRAMLEADRYAGFAVITRDRQCGRVSVDRNGRPRVCYQLGAQDRSDAIRGMASAAAIHTAAGAERVLLAHHSGLTFDTRECDWEARHFLKPISELAWTPNSFSLFSSHQMSSCRMGGDAAKSPVGPDGRLLGVKNLYLADGSVLPSASGINPMITIQSLARYTAMGIATT